MADYITSGDKFRNRPLALFEKFFGMLPRFELSQLLLLLTGCSFRRPVPRNQNLSSEQPSEAIIASPPPHEGHEIR